MPEAMKGVQSPSAEAGYQNERQRFNRSLQNNRNLSVVRSPDGMKRRVPRAARCLFPSENTREEVEVFLLNAEAAALKKFVGRWGFNPQTESVSAESP